MAAVAGRRPLYCRRGAGGLSDGQGSLPPAANARAGTRRRPIPGEPAVPRGRVGKQGRRGGHAGGRAIMNVRDALLSLPADLEAALLLGYAVVVLAGARLMERLARSHFERARRYSEGGFHYDADADHYHCPQGERLALHLIDRQERVAVYRAPASACAGCPEKARCTPHDEGRHLYRPLAAWTETDVGRFHQWLSLLMAASAAGLSVVALLEGAGRPGTGLLIVALLAAARVAVRDARSVWRSAAAVADDGPA